MNPLDPSILTSRLDLPGTERASIIGHEMMIPTLSTRRLKLEPLSHQHSQGMFELWSNADVCRYSGPIRDSAGALIAMPAASASDSDRIIEFWIQAASAGWGFRWAVLATGSNENFAGTAGFNSLDPCAEIAYHLLPEYWGRGFMTEACTAAIDWCRGNGSTAIDAFIEADNHNSIALIHRLGLAATDEVSDGVQRYRMDC